MTRPKISPELYKGMLKRERRKKMIIDIVNMPDDVIMFVEKDGNNYMTHFRLEEDAIEFAENVLGNIEYRVIRYDQEVVDRVLDKYSKIGKADL